MDPSQSNNRSTPAQFRSKLGTYLTGVAIGFIILGAIYYQKHRATQRLQAQKQAEQSDQSNLPTPSATETSP